MPRRKFINKEVLNLKQLLKTSKNAIVNLSDYQLNNDEKTLLSRGLSFCPEPLHVNRLDIHRNTLLFNRRLRLKHDFKDSDNRNYDPFGVPTGWKTPMGKSPHLDRYINITTREILEHKSPPGKCANLSQNELQALKQLRSKQNIVIKPADKGGAIVLMNKQDYLNEGLHQLNLQFYKEIQRNPTNKNTTDICKFLNVLKEKKLLPPHHINFLIPKKCRTPLFYLLPKIHKKNNPGLPIVSACDSPTKKISMFVDSYLKPLTLKVDSYIKDTTDFLHKLNSIGHHY